MFPFHDDQPTTRTPFVTVAIIAINVLVFLYTATLDEDAQNEVAFRYGFVPARLAQLFGDPEPLEGRYEFTAFTRDGREVTIEKRVQYPAAPGQVAVSLVTMMFLHGGVMHILGNMWFLWLYGNNIEDRLGHVLFTVYYFAGGLVATLCHWAVSSGQDALIPTIGASGAVAGVLGAYAVTYPFARVRTLIIFYIITVVELPALVVLGLWFVTELVSGLASLSDAGVESNVAFWAHIGGFAFGMVVMPVLCRIVPEITPPRPPDEGDWESYPPAPYGPAYGPQYGPPPGYGPGGFRPPPGYGPPPGSAGYRGRPNDRDDRAGIHFLDEPPRSGDEQVRRVVDDSIRRHDQDIRRNEDLR